MLIRLNLSLAMAAGAGRIERAAVEGSERPRADVHPAHAELVPQLHAENTP